MKRLALTIFLRRTYTLPKIFSRGLTINTINASDDKLVKPKRPFVPTTIEEVAGCLTYEGEAKTIEEMETAVQQTIRSIKQLIAGEPVEEKKRYGLGTAVAIGFGIFALINLTPILFLIPIYIFGY